MPPATISEWTWPENPWHRLHLDLADNGRQFVSGEFEQFTKMNGIRHTKTSPYNPSTNSLAERYEMLAIEFFENNNQLGSTLFVGTFPLCQKSSIIIRLEGPKSTSDSSSSTTEAYHFSPAVVPPGELS
ncbi:K02A2.6-like [Cordylochernes scorpioides]|uniref:K02A2.6-like n=1 Tax=Cordylochernes scorpioides TaxID=51811 RepID=A0ABY6LCX1_9ARAC|nr:K02A2.6-like [Cordylochernes scorpioides]